MSTKVGGIPEVLPSDMIFLTETNPIDISDNLTNAIELVTNNRPDPMELHRRVCKMYSWEDVAERTEKVHYFSCLFFRSITQNHPIQRMK